MWLCLGFSCWPQIVPVHGIGSRAGSARPLSLSPEMAAFTVTSQRNRTPLGELYVQALVSSPLAGTVKVTMYRRRNLCAHVAKP